MPRARSRTGSIIKALATNDVEGVDPVLAIPTIDLSAHEPERNFRDVVFPANLVNLTRVARRWAATSARRFVLNAGQYRPDTPRRRRPGSSASCSRSTSRSRTRRARTSRRRRSSRSARPSTAARRHDRGRRRPSPCEARGSALQRHASAGSSSSSTTSPGRPFWTDDRDRDAPGRGRRDGAGHGRQRRLQHNKGFNFLSVLDTGGPEILIDSPLPGRRSIAPAGVPARVRVLGSVRRRLVRRHRAERRARSTRRPSGRTRSRYGRPTSAAAQTDEARHYFVRYAFDGLPRRRSTTRRRSTRQRGRRPRCKSGSCATRRRVHHRPRHREDDLPSPRSTAPRGRRRAPGHARPARRRPHVRHEQAAYQYCGTRSARGRAAAGG